MSKTERKNEQNDNELTIFIVVPAQQEPWETSLSKTTKVSEVIQKVIDQFGFATNGKYELKLEDDPNTNLIPERPLVSYGVKDGDKLIFIDFGQAV